MGSWDWRPSIAKRTCIDSQDPKHTLFLFFRLNCIQSFSPRQPGCSELSPALTSLLWYSNISDNLVFDKSMVTFENLVNSCLYNDLVILLSVWRRHLRQRVETLSESSKAGQERSPPGEQLSLKNPICFFCQDGNKFLLPPRLLPVLYCQDCHLQKLVSN